MEMLERLRASADGSFGIKVQPEQLLELAAGNFEQAVSFLRDFDKVIVMLRKDKAAQAVSGAIARTTGRWFNFGETIELTREHGELLFPLIAEFLTTFLKQDALADAIMRQLTDRPLLVVHYEDLVQDPEGVTRRIVKFLAPELESLPPEDARLPVTERPAGEISAIIRADFLAHIANADLAGS